MHKYNILVWKFTDVLRYFHTKCAHKPIWAPTISPFNVNFCLVVDRLVPNIMCWVHSSMEVGWRGMDEMLCVKSRRSHTLHLFRPCIWTWLNESKCLLFCPDSVPDSDTVSMSRRGIEDKLVEEYRNCHYYKETQAELGEYNNSWCGFWKRSLEVALNYRLNLRGLAVTFKDPTSMFTGPLLQVNQFPMEIKFESSGCCYGFQAINKTKEKLSYHKMTSPWRSHSLVRSFSSTTPQTHHGYVSDISFMNLWRAVSFLREDI